MALEKLQEKAVEAPLGLYLHIPFCARSCDFCAFYQEPPRRPDLERYLAGMEAALARQRPDRPAGTAFWGGGTPGLLPARDLERLGRAMVRANGGVVPGEWTVEMAPATVSADRLEALAGLGVSRISVGVQSFQADQLEALGRIHTRRQVDHAISLLRGRRDLSVNLDLIFAIPGQQLGSWEADLRAAAGTGAHHCSCYCLTFEEDTALWLRLSEGKVRQRSEEEEAEFYCLTESVLAELGLEPYEISNYARPGHQCIHNVNTWRMGEWLGYGPSASSQYGGWRWTEPHSLEEWLAGLEGTGPKRRVDEVRLDAELLAQDLVLFGLRRHRGVDEEELAGRFGAGKPAGWAGLREQLLEEGLAERAGPVVRLTQRGRLLADRVAVALLEAGEREGPSASGGNFVAEEPRAY